MQKRAAGRPRLELSTFLAWTVVDGGWWMVVDRLKRDAPNPNNATSRLSRNYIFFGIGRTTFLMVHNALNYPRTTAHDGLDSSLFLPSRNSTIHHAIISTSSKVASRIRPCPITKTKPENGYIGMAGGRGAASLLVEAVQSTEENGRFKVDCCLFLGRFDGDPLESSSMHHAAFQFCNNLL